MEFLHILVLAILQGLTEFLPISSSAHLILPARLLDWDDQGLVFDIAVHVGTLSAVLIYFRKDLFSITTSWYRAWFGIASAESRMAWYLIVATIPVVCFGFLFNELIELHLRSVTVIALATLFFGLLLGVADNMAKRNGSEALDFDHFSWSQAMIVGLAQALALIPGTSRSGITMTAALMLGFKRQAAARFSFLLSIPVILSSGIYKTIELGAKQSLELNELVLGALISGMTAFLTIHFFLRIINRIGMMPFVWYRLLLGTALLLFLANGT